MSVSNDFGKAFDNHADSLTKLNKLLRSLLRLITPQEKARSHGSPPFSLRKFSSSS